MIFPQNRRAPLNGNNQAFSANRQYLCEEDIMFGIGSTELLVILLVALIVLGPKSLAGVSRSLGRAMGEFRKVSNDFQRTLNVEAAREEAREK